MCATLDALIDRASRHPWRCVAVAGLVSFVFRLALAPFGVVLVADAFAYLIKSLEIARGTLTPMESHAIGWPAAMAPFWLVLPDMSIAARMDAARVISSLAGAVTVVPLYILASAMAGPRRALLVLALFSCSAPLVLSGGSAMTEPLSALLLTAALAAAAHAGRPGLSPVWAPAIAGLAYWVRKDGLFVALIVLIVFWLRRRTLSQRPVRMLAVALVAFAVAASPALYQRYRAFGSPTYFGANNKYFVDDREQVWSSNVPAPTLLEYARTHRPRDFADKFLVHGFLKAGLQAIVYAIGPPLLPFFVWGLLRHRHDARLAPAVVSLAVWLVGLTPVIQFYDSGRHFFPIAPVLLVPTVLGALDLTRASRKASLWRAGLLALYVVISLGVAAHYRRAALEAPTQDGVEWGRFIAGSIKGKVALIEEASFVMMHLPDASVAGAGLMDLYAPESRLSTVRPGYFARLGDAMRWMRSIGVTHLVVDEINIDRRPYLREIDPRAPPVYLEPIYSNFETSSRWKVRVYAIHWELFGRRDAAAGP